jgi:hypothetical protein
MHCVYLTLQGGAGAEWHNGHIEPVATGEHRGHLGRIVHECHGIGRGRLVRAFAAAVILAYSLVRREAIS